MRAELPGSCALAGTAAPVATQVKARQWRTSARGRGRVVAYRVVIDRTAPVISTTSQARYLCCISTSSSNSGRQHMQESTASDKERKNGGLRAPAWRTRRARVQSRPGPGLT